MFLALRDLRFATGRFALMGSVVALISLLLVMLSGLTAGLGGQNTAAIDRLGEQGVQRLVFGGAAGQEPGELQVRAAGTDPRAGFFREYLKDPAATAEAWAGGWFHTGDVVRRAPDGSLHFVDRRKNVIRRSGENIAAVEVEGALRQHPGVAGVAVAPTADPVRGEEVFACVVAQPHTQTRT